MRVKNHFASETVEELSLDSLLTEFYRADCMGYGAEINHHKRTSKAKVGYKHVLVNLEVESEGGAPIVCEVEVRLSSMSALRWSARRKPPHLCSRLKTRLGARLRQDSQQGTELDQHVTCIIADLDFFRIHIRERSWVNTSLA